MTVPLSGPLLRVAASRPRLPRRTLRLRLTVLYGGVFLLSGAALLAITYLLVVNATGGFIFTTSTDHGHDRATIAVGAHDRHPLVAGRRTLGRKTAGHAKAHGGSVTRLQAEADRQHSGELHQLLVQSGIALAGMSVASILLGWIVAGRALGPLRTITETTREISATSLHRRLALGGPDDELKDLSDTIDALLARLEDSFGAQRAFVANASHELRTPLALTRAMLQFALADPQLTFDALKATCADVLDAGSEHEQLIEALLMLARGQQGIERRETFDLAQIVREAIDSHRHLAAKRDITIHASLTPARVSGDPRLMHRLASNLVENGLRYNVAHGHLRVVLDPGPGHATLTVANTGPPIAANEIQRLTQPFTRLPPDRTTETHRHGLGLSIVAAIATAHHANLNIQPNPEGGLVVAVTLPTPGPSKQARPPSVTRATLAASTTVAEELR